MVLMSMEMDKFKGFLPLFSIGYGICNGLTYMVPLQHGWLWFPQRPGLISGIIMGGYAMGSFSYGLLCHALVNPENETPIDNKFSDTVNSRVPFMMLMLTTSSSLFSLLAILLIFPGRDPTGVKEARDAMEKAVEVLQYTEYNASAFDKTMSSV